jgi:hypothetical protein
MHLGIRSSSSRRRGSFVSTTSPFLARPRLRFGRAGVDAAGGAIFTITVVGSPIIALATKARANAARS